VGAVDQSHAIEEKQTHGEMMAEIGRWGKCEVKGAGGRRARERGTRAQGNGEIKSDLRRIGG
jgi:hypothetical protein